MPDAARPTERLAYLIMTEAPEADFRGDVLDGLSRPAPAIPPKYFYNEKGASLFEDICSTEDYYVTKAETALIEREANDIARTIGPDASLFEPGSGAATKIRPILRALDRPGEYTLFDISQEQMERVAGELRTEFPSLRLGAVAGDFTRGLPEDDRLFSGKGNRVCFFPGGTIGNFAPDEQKALLSTFRKALRPGDILLLGADARKDSAVLDAAYNDTAGYTAAFNLNLLNRMKRELDADLDLDAWMHVAYYDEQHHRIRMFLRPRTDTRIVIGDRTFDFPIGRPINTEASYKFDPKALRTLGKASGYTLEKIWDAGEDLFYLACFRVAD